MRDISPGRSGGGFSWSDPFSQVLLVHGLSIAAFAMQIGTDSSFVEFIGLGCGVAAVIIAASKRDEGPGWARSHQEFALRSVVIAGCLWVLLSLPLINLIGWAVKWLVALWLLVRAVVGIVRALDRKPIPDPRTMLV